MSPRLLTFMVAFAAFLGPFTQTVYAPILPELGEALKTTPLLINLSISIFTFVLAFMQIVYGPLVDRTGRKPTLLAGLGIYIVASLGCFWSGSIEMLLAFRALQAVGIAAGAVVAVTVIGDRFEGAERGRAMGSFQMMVALGPVVGPVVGGFLGEHLDFHYVFLLLAIVGGVALLSNAVCLEETRPAGSQPRAFHPGQYLEVLRNRQGLAIMLLSFVQYYAFYNYLVFMPRVLDSSYGLSAAEKGMVFLPLSIAVVIGSFSGGRLLAGTTDAIGHGAAQCAQPAAVHGDRAGVACGPGGRGDGLRAVPRAVAAGADQPADGSLPEQSRHRCGQLQLLPLHGHGDRTGARLLALSGRQSRCALWLRRGGLSAGRLARAGALQPGAGRSLEQRPLGLEHEVTLAIAVLPGIDPALPSAQVGVGVGQVKVHAEQRAGQVE